jgi:hypothetical protein
MSGIRSQRGFVLGSDEIATYSRVNGILMLTGMRSKSLYEYACDNAYLLSYEHIHNIVATSQGLFKVYLTKTKKLDNRGWFLTNAFVPVGNWVNACNKGKHWVSELQYVKHKVLLAQSRNIFEYPQNHFLIGAINGVITPDEKVGNLNLARNQVAMASSHYTTPENGGAMPSILTVATSLANVVDPTVVTTDDRDKRAYLYADDHAIYYISLFRKVCTQLKIGKALLNMHKDLQVELQHLLDGLKGESSSKLKQKVCGATSSLVHYNNSGNVISGTLLTPDGYIQNPASVRSACASLAQHETNAPVFANVRMNID